MGDIERWIVGSIAALMFIVLAVLGYLSGAWMLPLAGLTWLPVIWMCITNKPLF